MGPDLRPWVLTLPAPDPQLLPAQLQNLPAQYQEIPAKGHIFEI